MTTQPTTKESNMKKPEHIATATVKVAVDFDALADSFQAIADAIRAAKPAEDTKESNMSTATKYRKKPVVIEAMEFTGKSMKIIEWLEANRYPFLIGNALEPETLVYPDQTEIDDSRPDKGIYIDPANGNLMIRTLEGDMRTVPGDFIIRGVQGELYPCRSDIFAQTYEQVTS